MSSENLHHNHRQRMLSRFQKEDCLEHFQEHEAIEMLLFFAIPRKDTKPIAHRLIKQFGCFSAVFEASFSELCRIEGIGAVSATLIRFVGCILKLYTKDKLRKKTSFQCREDIGHYLKAHFFGSTSEVATIITLNGKLELIKITDIAMGSPTEVAILPRRVLEIVLQDRAAAVVLAHCHPHGILLPSPCDIHATRAISEALKSIGAIFLDHMIVNEEDFVSLAETALYAELFGKS